MSRCYCCYRPELNCMCHYNERVHNKTNIVILMHPKEAYKIKVNTGRLSSIMLDKSEIVVDVDFSNNKIINRLIDQGDCYILYPGENSFDVSKNKLSKTVKTLFVIDATWPLAKKMMKLSVNLHDLPRVSFTTDQQSIFDIKHQPQSYCLSTLESIKIFLDHTEAPDNTDMMTDALSELVAFQKHAALTSEGGYRRSGPFKKTSERKESLKWKTRKLLFKD